jgi:7-cyano-7-deazaguanine synthase
MGNPKVEIEMKAVILLSGGLDSSTVLYQAKADGYECYPISFDYQQRHRRELQSAFLVAEKAGIVKHQVVNFDLRQWGGSALTDDTINFSKYSSHLRTCTEYDIFKFCPGLCGSDRSSKGLHWS